MVPSYHGSRNFSIEASHPINRCHFACSSISARTCCSSKPVLCGMCVWGCGGGGEWIVVIIITGKKKERQENEGAAFYRMSDRNNRGLPASGYCSLNSRARVSPKNVVCSVMVAVASIAKSLGSTRMKWCAGNISDSNVMWLPGADPD